MMPEKPKTVWLDADNDLKEVNCPVCDEVFDWNMRVRCPRCNTEIIIKIRRGGEP